MKYETWYVNNCDQESILIHADKYEEKFPRENLSFMYNMVLKGQSNEIFMYNMVLKGQSNEIFDLQFFFFINRTYLGPWWPTDENSFVKNLPSFSKVQMMK